MFRGVDLSLLNYSTQQKGDQRQPKMKILLVFTILMTCLNYDAQGQEVEEIPRKRVCYYTNWSQYKPEPVTFFPSDIDVELCTHIIYAFAKLIDNHIYPTEWNDVDMYAAVMALKNEKPTLKVLLGVGGWNHGMAEVSEMLATRENRLEFILHSIEYLRQYEFDGIDLDFQYPGAEDRGSVPADKYRYTFLVEEMRLAYEIEAALTNQNRLLIAAAMACGREYINGAYEVDKIHEHLDWMGLMSYDLNGAWNDYTGHNSPLTCRENDPYPERTIEWCTNYYRLKGIPNDKLVVGLATYGRGYTLTNPDDHFLYSPASGACKAGEYTREAGILAYYEVCSQILQDRGQRIFNEQYMVPYAYSHNQWASYDDLYSIKAKTLWILNNNYAGYMVWSYDLDDWTGDFCGDGRYPLMNMAKRIITGEQRPLPETNPPTPVPSTPPYTGPSTQNIMNFCRFREDGDYVHPVECDMFITCYNGETFEKYCPSPLYFNPIPMLCDWDYNLSEERREECGIELEAAVETKEAPAAFDCTNQKNGNYAHHTECNKHIQCTDGQAEELTCRKGLFFNPKSHRCTRFSQLPVARRKSCVK